LNLLIRDFKTTLKKNKKRKKTIRIKKWYSKLASDGDTDEQKSILRLKIMGHMGMDVLNTTSRFRMKRSIIPILG
jgi:hypothetical protein